MDIRSIRLKEFPPNCDMKFVPPESYIAEGRDISREEYRVRADAEGLMITGLPSTSGQKIILLGESIFENIFVHENERIGTLIQNKLASQGYDVEVLNAGYSGATSLHNLNVLINKIIPINPTGIFLMSGIMDKTASKKKAGFWSSDRYLSPLTYNGNEPSSFDNDEITEPDYTNRIKLLDIIKYSADRFGIPVWLATTPHLQVRAGRYATTFHDERGFSIHCEWRRLANAATRTHAGNSGGILFDIEPHMENNPDFYQDDFHLTAAGNIHFVDILSKVGFFDTVVSRIKSLSEK